MLLRRHYETIPSIGWFCHGFAGWRNGVLMSMERFGPRIACLFVSRSCSCQGCVCHVLHSVCAY